MTPHPTPWTAEIVTAGLGRFYHEIARVGLVFPLAARPIAVDYPGYPVIALHPIEGLEFVEEAVTALGSSTELAHHLFGHVLVQAQSRRCSGEHRGECRLAHVYCSGSGRRS
jgi:hypothetical protein